MIKRQLFLLLMTVIFTQAWAQREITGNVTSSEDGSTLPGVNVVIVGTQKGTITDADGNYRLAVPEGAQLSFSYIGYKEQIIDVGNRSVIDVVLEPDVTRLEEVVVTSLGIQRDKMALGYAVGEVKGDDLTEARELNLANALSGKVAGLNVSNMATGPAGSSRVLIRGNSSLSTNNQPLYVVDGIPMDNTNFGQAGMWGGSDKGDGTISINPDDIQDISVLKGGAAAALYGSRASNGVILITTKHGKKGKGLGIEFNSNYVFETIYDHTDYQTEYGNGNQGRAPSSSQEGYDWSNNSWGAKIGSISEAYVFDGTLKPYVNTFEDGGNNFKKFYQIGHTFTNTLAVDGGGEKQTYRASVSYLTNQSPLPNAGFNRFNLGLNTTGTYGKFEMSAKILYSNEDAENRPRVSDAPGNPHVAVYTMGPTYDVRWFRGDPNKAGAIWAEQTNPGQPRGIGEELSFSHPWKQNPYWAAYQYVNSDTRDRIISHVMGKFNFTDHLWLRGRIGLDWQTKNGTVITPYGTSYQRKGSMNEQETRIQEINYEWMAGYDNTWGKFGLNAFIGGNSMRRKYEFMSLNASNMNIPFFHSVTNGANQNYWYGFSEQGINSVFGSAELSYGSFVYLTLTGRNDWFSTLNPETNSIFYPSVSLSYVFSEHFKLPSWWNDGQLRLAWAQVGGGTSPYKTLLTYSLEGSGHLGYPLGRISQSNIPNPFLKPLTKTDFEIGLNVGFLDNRLGLDIAYYQATTTDDILNASISQASGFPGTTVNVGEITNKGVELLLTGTPIRRAFTWDISINFAKNNNEVKRLDAEGKIKRLQIGEPRTRYAFIQHIIGHPYGMIVGYTHAEINGQKVYDPVNGYPVITDSLSILGNGVHKITGGINNSFTWKGFNMSFLLDFKFDGDIYSGTNVRLTQWGLHKQTLEGRDGIEVSGVDPEGHPVNMVVPMEEIGGWWGRYGRASNYFVYDASFIKLRQITFGYTFSQNLLNKTPFKTINLSFVGRNLWLVYKKTENIDPESNYSSSNAQGLDYFGMPQTRSYGFNLRIMF